MQFSQFYSGMFCIIIKIYVSGNHNISDVLVFYDYPVPACLLPAMYEFTIDFFA